MMRLASSGGSGGALPLGPPGERNKYRRHLLNLFDEAHCRFHHLSHGAELIHPVVDGRVLMAGSTTAIHLSAAFRAFGRWTYG